MSAYLYSLTNVVKYKSLKVGIYKYSACHADGEILGHAQEIVDGYATFADIYRLNSWQYDNDCNRDTLKHYVRALRKAKKIREAKGDDYTHAIFYHKSVGQKEVIYVMNYQNDMVCDTPKYTGCEEHGIEVNDFKAKMIKL